MGRDLASESGMSCEMSSSDDTTISPFDLMPGVSIEGSFVRKT